VVQVDGQFADRLGAGTGPGTWPIMLAAQAEPTLAHAGSSGAGVPPVRALSA